MEEVGLVSFKINFPLRIEFHGKLDLNVIQFLTIKDLSL